MIERHYTCASAKTKGKKPLVRKKHQHFMAGSEDVSPAQAAVPPLTRVLGKNAHVLPHGQAHGCPYRQHPKGKTQMGQTLRLGL